MTTRSEALENNQPVKAAPKVTWNQGLGGLMWLLGCATTYQVAAILMDGATWGAVLVVSFVAQVVLTSLESPTLRGKPNPISLAVLGVDTLINAGGVYLILDGRLERLPTTQMVAEAAGQPAQLSALTVAAVSFIIGFILAATPEAVWRRKS